MKCINDLNEVLLLENYLVLKYFNFTSTEGSGAEDKLVALGSTCRF